MFILQSKTNLLGTARAQTAHPGYQIGREAQCSGPSIDCDDSSSVITRDICVWEHGTSTCEEEPNKRHQLWRQACPLHKDEAEHVIVI